MAKNDQLIEQIELPKEEAPKQIAPPRPEATDPTARIINAWAEVEEILRVVGEQSGSQRVGNAQWVINILRNRELIAPGIYELFQNLRGVRNAVAHAKNFPTNDEANHYVAQAEVLKNALLIAGNSVP